MDPGPQLVSEWVARVFASASFLLRVRISAHPHKNQVAYDTNLPARMTDSFLDGCFSYIVMEKCDKTLLACLPMRFLGSKCGAWASGLSEEHITKKPGRAGDPGY